MTLNYLYYKLYRAAKYSSFHDTAEFTAAIFLGGLIGANVLVIVSFLYKLNILLFVFSSKYQGGLFSFFSVGLVSIFYLGKKRYKKVIVKYSKETNRERMMGNIAVAIYVTSSFLSIFAVAFFRQGKL